jgi:hypothetical protein
MAARRNGRAKERMEDQTMHMHRRRVWTIRLLDENETAAEVQASKDNEYA